MIRLRIVSVDMYGFNGREHHPMPSDKGLVVTPVSMEAVTFDIGTGAECKVIGWDEDPFRLATHPDLLASEDAALSHGYQVVQMWTCVTADGRILDLVNSEVVVHSAHLSSCCVVALAHDAIKCPICCRQLRSVDNPNPPADWTCHYRTVNGAADVRCVNCNGRRLEGVSHV